MSHRNAKAESPGRKNKKEHILAINSYLRPIAEIVNILCDD